jgi:SAM-dependent methyltransferase
MDRSDGGYDWVSGVLRSDVADVYGWSQGVFVDSRLNREETTLWRQSTFSSRALVPFTTTWCEQQLGERELRSALHLTGISLDDLVMDLGCGDGRYVRFLLTCGFRRIVALNYELEPLLALRARLTDSERSRVLLVCADILTHPLVPASADFVLAWGLLTSTSDFRASLRQCLQLVKPQAWFFNAEPVLEHALVYALVKGDLAEFQQILTTKTRARMWHERDRRYRVLTLAELAKAMAEASLETISRGGISVFPSLVFGGLLDGDRPLPPGVSREELWQAIADLPVGWHRHVTFLSRTPA